MIANINVGILYIFAISSLGVYGIIMAGWPLELEISVPGGAALGGADGVVRSLDWFPAIITVLPGVSFSLNLSKIVEAVSHPATGMQVRAGSGCRCCRCSVIFFVLRWRDDLVAVDLVEAELELVAKLHGRVRLDPVPDAACSARHRDLATMCAMAMIRTSWWLAAAVPGPAVHLGAGRYLVVPKRLFMFSRSRTAKAIVPQLPLRPAHAPGLEGVPADFAGDGRPLSPACWTLRAPHDL